MGGKAAEAEKARAQIREILSKPQEAKAKRNSGGTVGQVLNATAKNAALLANPSPTTQRALQGYTNPGRKPR